MVPVLNLIGGGLAQAVHLSSSPQESLKSRDFAVYMSDTQSTVCKSSRRAYQDDWTSSLKSSYKTTFKLSILHSKCLLNACSNNVIPFYSNVFAKKGNSLYSMFNIFWPSVFYLST